MGGRWQNGSAAAAGEEMEQLFSYLSRFNITTKSMTAASKMFSKIGNICFLAINHDVTYHKTTGREEQLTETIIFWNGKKVKYLPRYLKMRLHKVCLCVLCINHLHIIIVYLIWYIIDS